MEFNVGDIVRIARTSEFWEYDTQWNPRYIDGEIYDIDSTIYVRWSNNATNAYSEEDLELVTVSDEELEARRLARLEAERIAKQKELEEAIRLQDLNREFIDKLKVELTNWHGDNYDVRVNSDRVEVIIHYPIVNLVSENRLTHTIHDLYVKVTFKDGKALSGLSGWRQSYTKAEVLSDYAHSHLSGIPDRFDSFCLGSSVTPVKACLMELSLGYTPEKFGLLLACIDSYVAWESISGVPYRKIEDISSKSRRLGGIGRSSIDRAYDWLIDKVKLNKLNLKLTFNKSTSRFEYVLDDNFMSIVDSLPISKVYRTPDRSSYVSSSSDGSGDLTSSSITYKGETISNRIMESKVDEVELIECAHPDYYKELVKRLNSNINDARCKQVSKSTYSKVERIISIQQA